MKKIALLTLLLINLSLSFSLPRNQASPAIFSVTQSAGMILFRHTDSTQTIIPCRSVASIVSNADPSKIVSVWVVQQGDYDKIMQFDYSVCGFSTKQEAVDSVTVWASCLYVSDSAYTTILYTNTDSATITSYDVLNSQNAPPGSPATGDTYLVGTSPSGAWVGHAKDIAEWNGSAWVFTDGVQGDFLYNATNALTYIFRSGNWVQTTGIPALNNGNTISSGLRIGTNNAFSLNFETNNTRAARIDSAQRFHIYNLPNASDTLLLTADINGKLGTVNVRKFIDSIYFKRTIAQLRAAMAAKALRKNAKYEATDFQTIYDQPDFNSDGSPKATVVTKTANAEHLVFTANSDSTFDNYVSSIEFPTDKIKFDFTYTQTEYSSTPAKGRITYREDVKGNITDYDFRNVLFKRYERTTGSGVYSEWKDNGEDSDEFLTFGVYDYSFGNTFTGYTVAYSLLGQSFILPNVVFQGTAIKNKFDVVFNSTFVGDANENIIGDGSKNIIALGGMYYGYFGHQAWNVLFLQDSDDNYFGDKLENCIFGNGCSANSIWDKMTNFTAGNNFERNIQYGEWKNSTVGNNFTDGVIYGITDSITCGDNNFKIEFKSALAITIGDNNSNIAFGGTKHIMPLNDINGVKNVAFGGSIDGYNWTNGINTTDHPEFYNTTTKQVLKASNGNVYGRYFNGSADVNTIIN
jgi:hypothetical protein